jgi:glycosyltransferase involved in cell wall biosynthesis
LVSCIVPVFNGERYLREALDSILAQTHPVLEVIVVDDGSTDSTAEIVRSYADRVRNMRQANAGPAAARNYGLGAARGQFVAFLDADDRWHGEKLARQLARFAARPELDLSYTHVRNFWIPELREEEERLRDHRLNRPTPAYLAATLLARRRVFETVGGFDVGLGFGHSTDWHLRATEAGAISEMLDDVLYLRRIHQRNRSREFSARSRDEYLRLVKSHLDRQRGTPPRSTPASPKRDADS